MKTIKGKKTIPLNGHRMRTLAQYLFNNYEAEDYLKDEGERFLVPEQVLKNLPEFDETNQTYVNGFMGDVIIEVIEVNKHYGVYVSVEPAPSLREMNDKGYSRWVSCIKVVNVNGGLRSWIGVYWKDIRPEDKIMSVYSSSLKDCNDLINETVLCQQYWCRNDLVYRIAQLYGDTIQKKLQDAYLLD